MITTFVTPQSFMIEGETTADGKGQNSFKEAETCRPKEVTCERDRSNAKNRWDVTVTVR